MAICIEYKIYRDKDYNLFKINTVKSKGENLLILNKNSQPFLVLTEIKQEK